MNQTSAKQMAIEIRTAEMLDVPELKKLNDFFNGEGCSTAETIESSLKENGREIVCVAAKGNSLVGFCCGQIFASVCYSYRYAEITELYVMDEYRRQGIGRRLVTFTEEELCKHGVKHLHILTGEANEKAQALYRSCGYKKTSEILLDKNLC